MKKDKIYHFGACMAAAVVAGLLCAVAAGGALPCALAAFSAGMAIGIGKEYGDYKAHGNTWSRCDILADAIGAVSGALCVGGALWLWNM